jgi:hypothetical protein
MTSRAKINELTGKIVDAAMKVHTVLVPGLLESAYEACLAYELEQRGLKVHSHQAQLLSYLKLSGKKVGLLINFNTSHLKDGIIRLVNDF